MNPLLAAEESAPASLLPAIGESFSGRLRARARPLTQALLLFAVSGLFAPHAVAACEREVALADSVVHAGRGIWASGINASADASTRSASEKFALASTHCGNASLGSASPPAATSTSHRAANNVAGLGSGRARESEQLSLYDSPSRATPSAGFDAAAAARAASPSSMASSTAGDARAREATTRSLVQGGATWLRRDSSRRAAEPPLTKAQLRVQSLAPAISSAASRHRLDPLLLHAIASVESNHDTSARSSAGAIGVMQVMPATARRFGVTKPEHQLHYPRLNVDVGAAYLVTLRALYDNNLELMLAAYNAGEGAVARYGNRIPPYPETRNYVRRVLDIYRQLQWRAGRAAANAASAVQPGGTHMPPTPPRVLLPRGDHES